MQSFDEAAERFASLGLEVRRDPIIYGPGLFVVETYEAEQGLLAFNDAVFVFCEDDHWGVWWIGRYAQRPAAIFDSAADALNIVVTQNNWNVSVA